MLQHIPEIFLASTSPQRSQVMQELGIPFEILTKGTEETTCSTPQETVTTNARLKALDVLGDVKQGSIVFAADTVLSKDGVIYGKPQDKAAAKKTLQLFSNSKVLVYSGVAAIKAGDQSGWLAPESAEIEFANLSEELIDWYIATGEPLTRAGSIGISLIGEIFIKDIQGSYSCIAGLPKRTVMAMVSKFTARSSLPSFSQTFDTYLDIQPFYTS